MSWIRRFWKDRSGASTLLTVLMLPVLLGFTAFAVDGGMAYVTRRNAQGAADSAAHSAAVAYANGDTNLLDQARTVALQYGLKDGANGVTVTVNRPPTSGPYAGNDKAVEVIVKRPMLTFFSQMFGGTASNLTVRSVSLIGRAGDICVLALNPTKTWAVLVNGTPTLTLTDCAMQINSTAAQGMLVNGGAKITADQIRLGGPGYLLNGGPLMTLLNGFKTGAEAIGDPYEDTPVPGGACNYTGLTTIQANYNVPSAGAVTVICSDITINGSPKVVFPPGIYVFKGTNLTINGVAPGTVTAQNVTFVFAKSGTAVGTVVMNGAMTLDLQAPPTGATAGLLFFTDPTGAPARGTILNGTNTSHFTGAAHFPKGAVTINGSNGVSGECLQLIADNVTYNGSGTFGLDCSGVGVKPIGLVPANIVE